MKKTLSLLIAVLMLAVFSVGTTVLAADTPNLVAYYNFADAENLGKDVSGNGNDLTKQGTGTITQIAGATADKFGASFDGAALLAATETEGVDFSDALSSFTVSFDAQFTTNTDVMRLISSGYNGTQDGFAFIANRWDANIWVRPIVGDSPDGTPPGATDHWVNCYELAGIGSDAWHNYIMTYDNTTKLVTLYLDGEKVGEYTMTNVEHMSSPLCFAVGGSWGSWFTEPQMAYIGNISEIKMFDGVISDMTAIAAAGNTVGGGDEGGEGGEGGAPATTPETAPQTGAETYTLIFGMLVSLAVIATIIKKERA